MSSEDFVDSVPQLQENDEVGSELTFFREKDMLIEMLKRVWYADNETFQRQFTIMDGLLLKYLEQPHLVCCHAEQLILPMNEKFLVILLSTEMCDDASKSAHERFHASDPGSDISNSDLLDRVCRIFHLLSRVVGFKYLAKYLPHEVNHMEGCIRLFALSSGAPHPWQTEYVLLIWLSTLCMIPFDIHSMDSSILADVSDEQFANNVGTVEHGIVSVITSVCHERLNDPGPTREAAAVCMSSLLTRPDMEIIHMREFADRAFITLNSWANSASGSHSSSDYFLLLGILRTLVYIFKKGHRQKLLSVSGDVLTVCLKISDGMEQTAANKLLAKLIQRIGMNYLQPKIASWRYERGTRSLNLALEIKSVANDPLGDFSAIASVEKPEIETQHYDMTTKDYDNEGEDIPPEVDEVIDCMLKALCNKDTVVRWSAAKAVGRIAMRLTESFASDVIAAVHDLFSDEDADTNWHGGCLALAELSRRGLLLPLQLTRTMPLVVKALFYDIMRGQHSIGIHVRDAACYVCWAFARAYSPAIMKPFMHSLYASLLTIAVYDREINCRRAASAAFQEMVGRQGAENVPNGIELISVVDYFSLSSRAHAFTSLASKVVVINNALREPFMQHLLGHKIFHWDKDVRRMAAQAYADLLSLGKHEDYLAEYRRLLSEVRSVVNNVNARHGLLLTLKEASLRIARLGFEFDDTLSSEVISLLQFLEKSRIYRGRGGELMRIAMCSYLESLADINVPISIRDQVAIIESLNDHLRQPHDAVQLAARDALRSCAYLFFQKNVETDPSDRLQALTVKKYLSGLESDQNVAVTRGYALALGALPIRLVSLPAGRLEEILSVLLQSAATTKLVSGEHDADTSTNVVNATAELGEKLCGSREFDQAQLDRILEILFAASSDYSVDKRGDTGSWSRMAAMRGVERIVYAIYLSHVSVLQASDGPLQPGAILNAARGLCLVRSVRHVGARSAVFEAQYCGERFMQSNSLDSNIKGDAPQQPPQPQQLQQLQQDKLLIIDNNASIENVVKDATDGLHFSKDQVHTFIAILLEQLAGKLDAAREVAGTILSRLVNFFNIEKSDSIVPCSMEDRELLFNAMDSKASSDCLGKAQSISWSDPEVVFPFVGQLLQRNFHFKAILNGLVVSIGGLSETTSVKATKCLITFCEKARTGQNDLFHILLDALLDIFRMNAKIDRLILPAVKTVNLLLREGVLDHIGFLQKQEFAFQLWECLRIEIKGCSSIQKLCAILDFMNLIVSFDHLRTRYSVLLSFLRLLLHKYPRVRKYCADTLYLAILSNPSLVRRVGSEPDAEVHFFESTAHAEAVQETISTTLWETGTKDMLLHTRNLLIEQMLLHEPDKAELNAVRSTPAVIPVRQVDEHDSYEALVREAGY